MIDKETKFRPVVGTDEAISDFDITPGYLYFAQDSGKIYLDTDASKRVMMGGSGSGGSAFLYAKCSRDLSKDESGYYEIYTYELEDTTIILEPDMLILNVPNGSFYRIVSVDETVIYCSLIASSGGSGGSSSGTPMDLTLEKLDTTNLINGKSQKIYFTATSALRENGKAYDDELTIAWSLQYTEDMENYTTYATGNFSVQSGVRASFDFGSQARESMSQRLVLVASQLNAEGTITRYQTFKTSDLSLSMSSSFSSTNVYRTDDTVGLNCNVVGEMDKVVCYWWDDALLSEVTLNASSSTAQSYTIPSDKLTHGYHKVKIELYQLVNGEKGISTDPLEFEIPIWDPQNFKPIIWLGEYDSSYYEYDTIQIPYHIYDPDQKDGTTTAILKKNNIEVSTRTISIKAECIYEIVDAEKGIENYYSIACENNYGTTERAIYFTLNEDTSRTDFKIQKSGSLQVSFDARGRSNDESSINREIIKDFNKNTNLGATFTNFNWYNNGWISDSDGNTCLRISNGAKLSIPVGYGYFNGSDANQQSFSFEIQFKVRNIQDYSNLIKNITRYTNDDALYALFYDEDTKQYLTEYTNYDAFLAYYLKNNSVPYTYKDSEGNSVTRDMEYDDLEYSGTDKKVNLSAVCCGYYSGTDSPIGICLGTQDAFFSNGTNTVSVSYVEDEIINLTVVYSSSNSLMSIYINGILTGIIKNTKGTFTIENSNIVFNSEYCDIDVYKFRKYNTDLSVNDVLMNYAYDWKNVTFYDQNKLASENQAINEFQLSYSDMITYNTNHPSAPLMPYIIFDTSNSNNGDRLSWSKKNPVVIDVEFVNTGLERAYTSGELESLAKADGLWSDGATDTEKQAAVKKYYKYHCPSWIGKNVNMAVQGTSSEFYPRRNYKLKTKSPYTDTAGEQKIDKDATNAATAVGNPRTEYKEYIHMMMNRGPYAEDYAADIAGYSQDEYILSTGVFDKSQTYYEDNKGENEITLTASTYQLGKYFIKNTAYRAYGKENTRLKYFYYDNYIAGTTKFTMKIDFMESSGSYNMGFANLVKNAYSKHPLEDYNTKGAFGVQESTFVISDDEFDSEEAYYLDDEGDTQVYFYQNPTAYRDEDGNPLYELSTGDFDENEIYYSDEKGQNVVTLTSETYQANTYYVEKEIVDVTGKYTYEPGKYYIEKTSITNSDFEISDTSNYRTSVQGFRVLAFHKKSNGTYQYIGMYNMLLDKGADEAYGFKPDKTTGKTVTQNFSKDKKVPSIAECWEFENNNRTFCSFRDPLNRKELSFDVYTTDTNGTKTRTLNSVKSAPVVADSFEYRYNKKADVLDYIVDPTTNADKKNAALDEYPTYGDYDIDNLDDRASIVFKLMGNWEKAVKWVWSTNTDVVPSQGTYTAVVLGKQLWATDTFYLRNEVTDDDGNITDYEYVKDTSDAYQEDTIYYSLTSDDEYENAYVVGSESLVYQDNGSYYVKDGDDYIVASGDFNEAYDYYILITDDDTTLEKKADVLVKKATAWEADTVYYTYNANAINNASAPSATTKVGTLTQAEFYNVNASNVTAKNYNVYYIVNADGNYVLATAADVFDEATVDSAETLAAGTYYTLANGVASAATEYNTENTYYTFDSTINFYSARSDLYVSSPVQYGQTTYKFDTQEYRAAKFINELSSHFDIEYLSTYFIMTEIFECYDSRGKNCMMASWGPQTKGGDYIWYPIFYDIDTQLGINNTGIPSFEYNIDATEDGSFSTSDSILWNNFYKYFKNSYILMKYKHIRGTNVGVEWPRLTNPPVSSVDKIESWYSTDPDVCGSISMRGVRPLVAINLDEYYKYITITNSLGVNGKGDATDGITGHIASDTTGTYTYDANGTYFYALQGNRSLSRRQFLTNRLEYIDSWLNQGNYQRGGANRIRGRIAANNATKTSDIWVATDSDPYYNASGTKNHLFDAEYWINLTPMRSSYVTVSDDNEAYPSKKYDGINSVKFEIDAIKSGVMTSNNYPEQLLYVYGLNQMKDLGDMSNLYWQEFEISGDASKLTTLKLGYDGLIEAPADATGTGVVKIDDKPYYKWFNNKVNEPSIPASSEATGMPLLKEVNFCNIQINTGTPTLDLTSCEKLENFRATGSNYQQVKFAEGVALNTCYLPKEVTELKLTEARLLTNLITEYTYPTRTATGTLSAEPGLYIEGLFEEGATSKLNTICLLGGNLGYNSLILLNQFYARRKDITDAHSYISMTDVNWCPYKKLAEGETYVADDADKYFVDNGHYGFDPYSYDIDNWDIKITNGELYKLNTSEETKYASTITSLDMLTALVSDSSHFRSAQNEDAKPNITGIIYINNDTAVDEFTFRNGLQEKYPNVTFFFKTITKAYNAKFVLLEADGTSTTIGVQSINGGWFESPVDAGYDISKLKANYDFYGWAYGGNDSDHIILSNTGVDSEGNLIVEVEDQVDYWEKDKDNITRAVSADDGYDYYFYAIMAIHKYKIRFYNYDGNYFDIYSGYSNVAGLPTPTLSELNPYRDDSDLTGTDTVTIDDETYTMEELTYKFVGWTRINGSEATVDLSLYTPVQNYTFYPVFERVPVYDTYNEDYFDFTLTSYYNTYDDTYNSYENRKGSDNADSANACYALSVKSDVSLRGKVVLPLTYNNKPVISIGAGSDGIGGTGFQGKSLVTHIFWMPGDPQCLIFGTNSFAQCSSLKKIVIPTSLKEIGGGAFRGDPQLEIPNFSNCNNLLKLGNTVYNGTTLTGTTSIFYIPGSVQEIGNLFFGSNYGVTSSIGTLQIGSPEHPTYLQSSKIGSNALTISGSLSDPTFVDVIVYVKDDSSTDIIYPSIIDNKILYSGSYSHNYSN